ncbi:MAG: SAVED domain-containing protein [Candidatus Nitrohelix vancouverensis]|uniref:SAVED domain-containing protein n=1 Tax=Candidatus Nitrohelix vancouverensis TaxID=2705534 RepID=A0A7T0C2V3_9BACT|nr:MAG: SAVED domain-containing protein [Candidatus Nitrohelix vancouverensis]
MSVSYIPEKIKVRLWGRAAGRCQYEGCNIPLWLDSLTKSEFNVAYIAHIIADKPDGPRGHPELSEKLKADISNLMLMCDQHHRLIDKEAVEEHSVERLQNMKSRHESRIELVTSLNEEKESHLLIYGANIGQHQAPLSWKNTAQAMLPHHYPADSSPFELGMKNSSFQDHEEGFWEIERENLKRQVTEKIKPRFTTGEIRHLSVFALAPQPLLIEMGRLLSDIPAADVFQLHREPPDWKWQPHPEEFQFILNKPKFKKNKVALNMSLSATIDNSRIISVLGDDVSIWTLTIESPYNDFLKSREQLKMFRETFRKLLNEIKAYHEQNDEIHLFPAVPCSVAVEIGRIWMPKADLEMKIYDQNHKTNGFSFVF